MKIVPETAIPPAINILRRKEKNFCFLTSLATKIDMANKVPIRENIAKV